MELYINSILTLIFITVYLLNTRSQNIKIKSQSDIIKDLQEHIKFFDLKKIKDYVELRENEKDKLMDATESRIKSELENKYNSTNSEDKQKNIDAEPKELVSYMTEQYVVEAYLFVIKKLIILSDEECRKILEDEFPKSKERIIIMLETTKKTMLEMYPNEDLDVLSKKFSEN